MRDDVADEVGHVEPEVSMAAGGEIELVIYKRM